MEDVILELNIKNDLDNGFTWDHIVEKYNVSRTKIQKIKNNGRWYVDMSTGETVFTSKSISIHEQVFHYIASQIELYDKASVYIDKLKIVKDRVVAPRICNWLMGEFNISHEHRESMERKCRGWLKKDVKLVKCVDGEVEDDIKRYACSFCCNEESTISKNYYLDENLAPRGWRLWSLKVSEDWLIYLSQYIQVYLSRGASESDLRDYMYKKIQEEIAEDKILYSIEGISEDEIKELIDKKYKKRLYYNFINSRVAIRVVEYIRKVYPYSTDEMIISNLRTNIDRRTIYLNPLLYMDITAYKQGLLSSEYRSIVESILETGRITDQRVA